MVRPFRFMKLDSCTIDGQLQRLCGLICHIPVTFWAVTTFCYLNADGRIASTFRGVRSGIGRGRCNILLMIQIIKAEGMCAGHLVLAVTSLGICI